MNIKITTRLSANKSKEFYYLEWGKETGQRRLAGIFTYTKPKDQIEKNHNKEAISILRTKQSELILERQSIGTRHIPQHRLESNFLDFYSDFVRQNRKYGNRHLENSLKQFRKFVVKDYISPIEINRTICEQFRNYLLANFNGETPANYFYKFKRVLESAKSIGYFISSPTESIKAKAKGNKKKKEVIEANEYAALIATPCLNHEVKKAFIFCLYTGLRWCDVKALKWDSLRKDSFKLYQQKTKVEVEVPLPPIALRIAGNPKSGCVFHLPTSRDALRILANWSKDAGLQKHITWHCARLSFSVLLQDEGVNTATVAGMLGHKTTKYVEEIYQRYRVSIGRKSILKLPDVDLSNALINAFGYLRIIKSHNSGVSSMRSISASTSEIISFLTWR